MKTAWTKGVEKDAKQEVKLAFDAGAFLRGRLSSMLTEKINAKEREMIKDSNYENANWAYLQADAQGYKRAMNEIISLLS